MIRFYNVFLLGFALYVCALFVFTEERSLAPLRDPKIHLIVLSSLFSVAAGYIINFFYDYEKDTLLNLRKSEWSSYIRKDVRLYLYLFLSFIGLVSAFFVSWKTLVFFFLYQFWIWFYCHKLGKILLVNNMVSTTLIIIPFFAIFMQQGSLSFMLLTQAIFVFILFLVNDILKDFYSFFADKMYNYTTLPTALGILNSKKILLFLLLLSMALAYALVKQERSFMKNYYCLYLLLVPFFGIYLLWAKTQLSYRLAVLFYRGLLLFALLLIFVIHINGLTLSSILQQLQLQ